MIVLGDEDNELEKCWTFSACPGAGANTADGARAHQFESPGGAGNSWFFLSSTLDPVLPCLSVDPGTDRLHNWLRHWEGCWLLGGMLTAVPVVIPFDIGQLVATQALTSTVGDGYQHRHGISLVNSSYSQDGAIEFD